MLNYPPEQLWPLYEKLPKDLQEAIFASKSADIIADIGMRNGLPEEIVSEIAKYTGYVLLGLLSPEKLEKTLKEDLKMDSVLAKKISWEISRFIFYPVKPFLKNLYTTELEELEKEIEKGIKESENKDKYREPIE
jgi:hypothetical protein